MQGAELAWERGGSVLCEGLAALEAVDGALGVACGAETSSCGSLERAAATYLATLGEVSVGLQVAAGCTGRTDLDALEHGFGGATEGLLVERGLLLRNHYYSRRGNLLLLESGTPREYRTP